MLISLCFEVPVIVVGECPVNSGIIILHFDFDSVSGITSPRGGCLSLYLNKTEECDEYKIGHLHVNFRL
jgi:hypothetical protein